MNKVYACSPLIHAFYF